MKNTLVVVASVLLLFACDDNSVSINKLGDDQNITKQQAANIKAGGVIIEYMPASSGVISETNKLIFEAGYSGVLGNVEVKIGNMNFKLEKLDDKELCLSLPLNDFSSPYKHKQFILVNKRYPHILVSDECLVASAISELENDIVIREKSQRKFSVVKTSSNDILIEATDYYTLWNLFGQKRPEVDLWNGLIKLPDTVTSTQLIRSIKAGDRYLQSAIDVVYSRHKLIVNNAHILVGDKKEEQLKIVRHQKTSIDVIKAFLDTKLLAEGVMNERRQMMRIFLSNSAKAHEQKVMEQLFLGLDREVEETRPQAVIDNEKQIEEVFNVKFGRPEGRPAYMTPRYLEAGALVALELGYEPTIKFSEKYKSIIVSNLKRNLGWFKVISVLAARSKYGEKLIIDLLNQVKFEKKVIPVIQTRIQDLILNREERSEQLRHIIKVRCSSPNSFFPNGDKDRAKYFCTRLVERFGEF